MDVIVDHMPKDIQIGDVIQAGGSFYVITEFHGNVNIEEPSYNAVSLDGVVLFDIYSGSLSILHEKLHKYGYKHYPKSKYEIRITPKIVQSATQKLDKYKML